MKKNKVSNDVVTIDNKHMVNTMKEVYDAQLKLKNKKNKELFKRLTDSFEDCNK